MTVIYSLLSLVYDRLELTITLLKRMDFFFFVAIFAWKTFPRHQSRDHCNVLIYFFDIFFSCLVMHSQSDNSFETSKNVVFLITKTIFFSIHKHRSQNGFVFFLKTNIINLFIIILLLLFFVC